MGNEYQHENKEYRSKDVCWRLLSAMQQNECCNNSGYKRDRKERDEPSKQNTGQGVRRSSKPIETNGMSFFDIRYYGEAISSLKCALDFSSHNRLAVHN